MDADVRRKQLAAALNLVAQGDRPALFDSRSHDLVDELGNEHLPMRNRARRQAKLGRGFDVRKCIRIVEELAGGNKPNLLAGRARPKNFNRVLDLKSRLRVALPSVR
jgi:hypothetical protein